MPNTLETLGQLERRLVMAVPVADIDRQVGERLKRLARTIRMAGFRPGKVPLKLVEQTYGPQVRSEVIGDAVQKSFSDAVRDQNLRVAGYPRIERNDAAPEGELQFSATFEVYPGDRPRRARRRDHRAPGACGRRRRGREDDRGPAQAADPVRGGRSRRRQAGTA